MTLGHIICRGCFGDSLEVVLNLGDLPIANELVQNQNIHAEEFPLQLSICKQCKLGQIGNVVSADRLFKDYRYLSSISRTFIDHAKDFVNFTIEKYQITKSDWILEIASNDGYLLSNFVQQGFDCVGIEPSENVSKIARDKGIPTITDYFSENLANELIKQKGYPRLVIANNVMAHVPNLEDFTKALRVVAGESTVISIENPSLDNIFSNLQFDSIYHEHFSYLSATSMRNLLSRYDLQLQSVEKVNTHGGSLRYWISRDCGESNDFQLKMHLIKEHEIGFLEPSNWMHVSSKIREISAKFRDFVDGVSQRGEIIWGFGAAAKASTILNYSKVNRSQIVAIADSSPEKQNRYMPNAGIPIVSPQRLYDAKPDHVIIFPWNIAEEISQQIFEGCGQNVRLWKLIPELTEIG